MAHNGSVITMFSRSNETLSGNIAAEKAWGHKKRENLFSDSFIGTNAGGVSYVSSKTRSTNSIQGRIVNTGVVSDMAIDGNGLFVVSDDKNGVARFTRRGDFRQDESGFWKNGSDQLLKAWKLDQNGNLPQNSSLLQNLEAVNLANTKGAPVATSVISIAMNLNADQDALRGGGIDAVINSTGINGGRGIKDIILPDAVKTGSLTLGDTFTFKSSASSTGSLQVTYGGIVPALTPRDTPIFGATSENTAFTFNTPAAPSPLADGNALRITLSTGQSYLFTAKQGAQSPDDGTFNTINGLAAAINNNFLKATVDINGRLYIAPIDPNVGITFTDVGGTIKGALGLVDLPTAQAQGAGITRFNSLETLEKAVNKNQAYSLKATTGTNDIEITSLLATSTFDITAKSPAGPNAIRSITQNPKGDDVGRATVFINAPGHSLKKGDFVNIAGIAGAVADAPNGLYSIGDVNLNGFFISMVKDDAQFPAAAASVTTQLAAGAASWQKVGGEHFTVKGGQIAASAAGVGQQNITITSNAHGLAVGDVIYVDGKLLNDGTNDITLPSGYYRVNNVANVNTFRIGATASVAQVPGSGFAGNTFNFRKVGSAVAAFPLPATGTFNTNVFSTINATNTVKYYIGTNHTYTAGDNITFTGLAAAGLAFANITIRNDIPYKVLAVDPAGFITFQLDTAAVANAAADSIYGAGAGDTPLALRADNGSQLMKYFSLDPNKTDFAITYDPNSADKNLSSSVNGNANFASDRTFSVPLTVYDSLGSPYTLILCFAKLNSNQWAVELVAQDGFDVTTKDNTNGLIQAGIINFNSDGTLQGIPQGFQGPITVNRTNGSATSNITIDWQNVLSQITSGNVSQTKAPNNVEIIQNNGKAAGTLTKLEVSAEGYIIGTFDSGETRKLYQIPVAMFANVNGLVAGSNGTFEISRESGEPILKGAGVGGAGKTLGGVLEGSNTDTTEELLKVQELSNTIRANARVAAVDNENFKNTLAELRG